MTRKLNVIIQGQTHTVTYSDEDRKNKNQLLVDGKEIQIPKNLKTSFVGVDCPFNIDGEECRFVCVFKACDIVVDGEFVDNKRPYVPLRIPMWAWLFVALSILIPIISIGGALPTAIACLSTIWCLKFSASPFVRTNKKILYNILTVISAWVLFGLLLFGLS